MTKSTHIIQDKDYKCFIHALKEQVQSSQIKAAVSVNRELLKLYWLIGSQIVEKQKQKQAAWGSGFIKQVSHDLQREFPDMKGFSARNLERMRKWYLYWSKDESIASQVVPQLDDALIFQIPWGQNLVIIAKSEDRQEALLLCAENH